ncbi:site-specific integrase [Haladaptatus sp. GCM10025707]|uniref:site-specific integrase n=1 Tax=unclassified Haladaptatus TaxID=2622732 RepID=UPI0023E87BFA|nr:MULTISPECIES: site-specific integrase [unclassified Haladaptatus]
MRLDPYPTRDDGMRVWLSKEEMQQLINEADGPQQKIAFLLGGRCGLRRSEITQVCPKDFVTGPTGKHVRIWEDYAKREHYREPPVPDNLYSIVETFAWNRDDDAPVVDVPDKYVYRWVRRAADRLQVQTGDEGWQFVGPHDLRRTWGTHLLEQGVLPSVVMAFGGWDDWDTFRRHYLGEFSPEAIRRECAKVDFLGGEPEVDRLQVGTMPQPRTQYRQ